MLRLVYEAAAADCQRPRPLPLGLAMNTANLVLALAVLVFSPAVFLPDRPRRPASSAPRPEIRGPIRLLHWLMIGYCCLLHRLRSNLPSPLPETGPAILIANHTCGIDHMLLQAASNRILGFMIAREYYEWPKIHWFCKLVRCIPVNRDGRDIHATRAAIRALEAGRVVPIFPEGRVTAASGRVLGPMRPGTAYIAVRTGVPVIPAYLRGTPETDQIGESLVTPSRSEVRFGPPLDLSDFRPEQAGDKDVQAEVSRRFLRAFLDLAGEDVTLKAAPAPAEPAVAG
ncbi:1-acyl-sn-glycerol-3-phosphate acyltransferase [Aquisphaera giovannonii]|uniref:1-acyl-sn-glycerol-3-phosphate acyltransferase n=1 Tax=Aquisphaera giovannonii TaxID=406548 RepID=A0A5B9VZG1_9BACT|nr:lysophospholipid acyltransferase family protein [Aquisphaera giovannonii]QEH33713.1 1-acyl-sn-glycerol-3-phosphate acyltransferase [Aquisphaera giovannonii]